MLRASLKVDNFFKFRVGCLPLYKMKITIEIESVKEERGEEEKEEE